MPRATITVPIVRPDAAQTPDGAGGYTQNAPSPIAGSPFACRLYRRSRRTLERDEAEPGIATPDKTQVLSIQDPTADIRINDVATLPNGVQALVLRVRVYARHLQCDIETGVNG